MFSCLVCLSCFMFSWSVMAGLVSLVLLAIHFMMFGFIGNLREASKLGASKTEMNRCFGVIVVLPVIPLLFG